MNGGVGEKKSMWYWWLAGVLIVLIAEAAVCMLLFIPQTKRVVTARTRTEELQQQVARMEGATDKIQALLKQVRESEKSIRDLKLYTSLPTPQAVMASIVGASDTSGVRFFSLTPAESPAGTAPRAGEGWRLRLKGDFAGLVIFLRKIEMEGTLLASRDFSADAIKDRGTTEIVVGVKTCSPETIAQMIADEQKAAATGVGAGGVK